MTLPLPLSSASAIAVAMLPARKMHNSGETPDSPADRLKPALTRRAPEDEAAGWIDAVLIAWAVRLSGSPDRVVMKRVTFGEIDGLSRKRGCVFVNGGAESRPRRMVALTRCPQRVTAVPSPRGALSVRSRDVRGAIVTRQVALEPRMKASRTLALSR